jgi:hypothetical protein
MDNSRVNQKSLNYSKVDFYARGKSFIFPPPLEAGRRGQVACGAQGNALGWCGEDALNWCMTPCGGNQVCCENTTKIMGTYGNMDCQTGTTAQRAALIIKEAHHEKSNQRKYDNFHV